MTKNITVDVERLFKHPAFGQLEPAQLSVLKKFARDIDGKNLTEVARLYMQVNRDISRIKPLTDTQRSAMTSALREFLPENERKKMDTILKMLG